MARYWEIYNEPDNGDEWRAIHGGYSYFGGRGHEYAALLEALYPVIKAANRNAQVVFGGIAADNYGSGFDPDFMDEVLGVLELPEAPEQSPHCQWCNYSSKLNNR